MKMDDYSNVFTEEQIRKIDKQKLEMIARMFNDMNKASSEERLQILFTYGIEMRSKGLRFSTEESTLLINVLKENLPDEEKEKMDLIVNLLKNM
jgi:hypothetical protein